MNRSAAILAAANLTHPKRWATKHMAPIPTRCRQDRCAPKASLKGPGLSSADRLGNPRGAQICQARQNAAL
ncbi:MAG: hypothetical protein L0Z50_25610 [Verrucomicrobiales bacterium]|nr:hypothetical protein [Verrucomicrobiales bacterium]